MKKEYQAPVIEIAKLNVSDIISWSPQPAPDDPDEGDIVKSGLIH